MKKRNGHDMINFINREKRDGGFVEEELGKALVHKQLAVLETTSVVRNNIPIGGEKGEEERIEPSFFELLSLFFFFFLLDDFDDFEVLEETDDVSGSPPLFFRLFPRDLSLLEREDRESFEPRRLCFFFSFFEVEVLVDATSGSIFSGRGGGLKYATSLVPASKWRFNELKTQ